MHLKLSVLTLGLTALSLSLHAQDKIYTRDGDVLEVKVKEISPRRILYKKWNNQSGPDYTINRSEVEKLVYENGVEEEMEEGGMGPGRPHMPHFKAPSASDGKGYGNNIISIAPLQMTNEGPAGVGIEYERVLDKRGIFSLYLPFALALYDDNYQDVNNVSRHDTRTFNYIYPGVKFYPTGSKGPVRYAVGPSIAIGFGKKYYSEYSPVTGQYTRMSENVFKSGLIINNSLNIQPTNNFYIGLELGLGFNYTDNEGQYSNNYYGNNLSTPVVQFNMKFGIRF